jgi:hypothetical protein
MSKVEWKEQGSSDTQPSDALKAELDKLAALEGKPMPYPPETTVVETSETEWSKTSTTPPGQKPEHPELPPQE